MSRSLLGLIGCETMMIGVLVVILMAFTPNAGPNASLDDGADLSAPFRNGLHAESQTYAASSAASRQIAEDPLAHMLFGRLRFREDRRGISARLWVVDDEGQRIGSYARNDSSGFVIYGLRPGNWRLRCEATEHRSMIVLVEIPNQPGAVWCELELEPPMNLDLEAVTPEGVPLAEALRCLKLSANSLVKAGWVPPHSKPGYSAVDHELPEHVQGRYFADARGEKLGTLEVRRDPPFDVRLFAGKTVVATLPVARETDSIRFVIDAESVAKVLGGVRMRCVAPGSNDSIQTKVRIEDSSGERRSGWTDADGYVEFRDLPSGRALLDIETEEHAVSPRLVEIEAGRRVELENLEVEEARTITGVLELSDRRPCQATFHWMPMVGDDPRDWFALRQRERTNADGSFVCSRVGRGRHLLMTTGTDAVAIVAVVEIGESSHEGLRINLPRASGGLITLFESPAQTVWGTIFAANGMPFWRGLLEPQRLNQVLLPRGPYVLELEEVGFGIRRIPFVANARSFTVSVLP